MMQDGSNIDPYTQSGAHAAAQQREYRQHTIRASSLKAADALEEHGRRVIRRGRRGILIGLGLLVLISAATALVGAAAVNAFREGPEDVPTGNWGMLGFVVGLGGLNFAWGWMLSQHRLVDTGRRLVQRAEHQRGIWAFYEGEDGHDAIR